MAESIFESQAVYAAALIPMRSDLTIDEGELLFHCNDLIRRGCQGIALFGTTGEGPSFSLKERTVALNRIVSSGFDPRKIIVANGSSGIHDTVELAREVQKHGCAALLVAPPSFYKNVSEEGVIAFYREIMTRIHDPELRVILYHIPQLSGVPITLNIIAALLERFSENVVGIKESEGSLSLTKAILETFPEMKVFVGKEKQIIEAVHLGATGAICGIANLYPELICSLLKKQDYQDLEPIFEALQGYPFIPAAKALMEERRGAAWSALRPPLIALNPIEREKFLRKGLQK